HGRAALRAKSGLRPEHMPILRAHAERHERASVVEVRPEPVPSRGLGCEELARPLVVEPRDAGHLARAALRPHTPRHAKLRLAVVIARLRGIGALAAES